MSTGIIVYFTTIILTIIFLVWWRTGCEWRDRDSDAFPSFPFPTRGHVVLLIIGSLAPIYNIIQLCVLISAYAAARICKDLTLKDNKFNNFWFKK